MACVELPKIPDLPSIQLLGGAELKGFLDFTQGAPTDCKITFNLLMQLSPVLVSMACLLKILNFIGTLQAFFEAAKSPPFNDFPKSAKDVLDAIADLSKCIPAFAGPQMILMIKGMLRLIISFLDCFLSQLSSLISFQASIDLKSAEGNPVLLEALNCARHNAETSMGNLMLSLQPLQPISDMITMVASIAGKSLTLPKFSDISANPDRTNAISSLRDAIDAIKQVIDALPG
jgi:hypothetical protein